MIKFGEYQGSYNNNLNNEDKKIKQKKVREKVMKLAKEAAEIINNGIFIKPIKIEFEKVYHP